MAKEKEPNYDEELCDVLIAISVVAKLLADKLEQTGKTEVHDNGEDEGTLGSP